MKISGWLNSLIRRAKRRTSSARSTLPLRKQVATLSRSFENLEDRTLLAADPLLVSPAMVIEPGTNPNGAGDSGPAPFQFDDGDRWDRSFTNGTGLTQGAPTTIRWGIIPDGSAISGGSGEPAAGSSLISFFDGMYGSGDGSSDLTSRPWFFIFNNSFERFEALSGLTFTYLAINSQPAGNFSIPDGTTNSATTPEYLVGAHPIDGQ